MSNEILLNKNKYATLTLAQLDANNLTNYNILLDKFKVKQKKYMTILLKFVEKYNEFINEKYPDTKENYLMKINITTTTNSSIFENQLTDINSVIQLIENMLQQLESYYIKLYGLTDANWFTLDIEGDDIHLFFYNASSKTLPGYYFKDIRSFKLLKYTGNGRLGIILTINALSDLETTWTIKIVDKIDKR